MALCSNRKLSGNHAAPSTFALAALWSDLRGEYSMSMLLAQALAAVQHGGARSTVLGACQQAYHGIYPKFINELRRCLATTTESSEQAQQQMMLSKSQLEAIQAAVSTGSQQAFTQSTRLATVTALAYCYRDISIAQEALYQLQVAKQKPLASEPLPEKVPAPKDPAFSTTIFPMMDLTQLPDNHPSVPQGPQQYDPKYMDRITCWMQTQPNHVETSTPLQAGIALFPPQEATYPTYVNFQAATRLLERHKSRKRLSVLRSIRKFQDKYQLRAWDHRPGE